MSFLCFINRMRGVTELNLISRMSREHRDTDWTKYAVFFLSQNASAQRISVRETNQITHQGASLIIQSSWRHRLSAMNQSGRTGCAIYAQTCTKAIDRVTRVTKVDIQSLTPAWNSFDIWREVNFAVKVILAISIGSVIVKNKAGLFY